VTLGRIPDDVSPTRVLLIILANVLGLLVGFMLGVVLRSSAGAIVAYFVYSFLLPTLAGLLGVTSTGWLILPIVVGVALVMRSEAKLRSSGRGRSTGRPGGPARPRRDGVRREVSGSRCPRRSPSRRP